MRVRGLRFGIAVCELGNLRRGVEGLGAKQSGRVPHAHAGGGGSGAPQPRMHASAGQTGLAKSCSEDPTTGGAQTPSLRMVKIVAIPNRLVWPRVGRWPAIALCVSPLDGLGRATVSATGDRGRATGFATGDRDATGIPATGLRPAFCGRLRPDCDRAASKAPRLLLAMCGCDRGSATGML